MTRIEDYERRITRDDAEAKALLRRAAEMRQPGGTPRFAALLEFSATKRLELRDRHIAKRDALLEQETATH